MKEVMADIERWRGRGETFALATVVATRRSASPCAPAGTAASQRVEAAQHLHAEA